MELVHLRRHLEPLLDQRVEELVAMTGNIEIADHEEVPIEDLGFFLA